jgi:hypothetical protein
MSLQGIFHKQTTILVQSEGMLPLRRRSEIYSSPEWKDCEFCKREEELGPII